MEDNILTINDIDYTVETKMINHTDLEYYAENPRIFSLLDMSNGIPDQERIQSTLQDFDHVKQLKTAIKDNGGLIDAIIVRNNVVLEGNSRLAAYRLLFEDEPLRWSQIKATILPNDFPEDAVFALLGQYHVSGKTKWAPYEQAGFLVRQMRASGRNIKSIAKVLGIAEAEAKRLVKVYEFMEQQNDLEKSHWSYYDEYLKNQGINKYRKASDRIDDVFVEQVKTGAIKEAIDVRKKLGPIAKSESREAKKIMNDIIDNKIDVYYGYTKLEDSGKIGDSYKVLQKFNERINDENFKKSLANENIKQIQYQLKQIQRSVKKLLDSIEKI